MQRYDSSQISPLKLHQLLLGSIAPRPIAFASTVDLSGNPNVSPFSFFNAFGVNPSTLIFSPARRNRDASTKHTYQNVKEVPEVVINVVTYDMVQQVSLASTEYDKGINEFVKAGFTPVPSEMVRPFRVGESPVQFECRVREVIETGSGPGAANLIVCEVLLTHIHDHVLDANGHLDPEKLRLVGRMGGDYYCKAFGEGIFKVQKPLERKGIGIDSLPESIRYSKVLTGNQLGKLGNVQALPDASAMEKFFQESGNPVLEPKGDHPEDRLRSLHQTAATLLDQDKITEALCLLMAHNQ